MGNYIGYVKEEQPRFHSDLLSERANNFINNYRHEWDMFMLNFARAKKYKDQRYLDIAISKIAPKLDVTLKGQEIWEELWEWLVDGNKEE